MELIGSRITGSTVIEVLEMRRALQFAMSLDVRWMQFKVGLDP